jgi:hypothetical protein
MGFASSSSNWREPAVEIQVRGEVVTELSPVVAFFDPHIGFASSADDERYLEGTEVCPPSRNACRPDPSLWFTSIAVSVRPRLTARGSPRQRLADAIECDPIEVIVRYANDVAFASEDQSSTFAFLLSVRSRLILRRLTIGAEVELPFSFREGRIAAQSGRNRQGAREDHRVAEASRPALADSLNNGVTP